MEEKSFSPLHARHRVIWKGEDLGLFYDDQTVGQQPYLQPFAQPLEVVGSKTFVFVGIDECGHEVLLRRGVVATLGHAGEAQASDLWEQC